MGRLILVTGGARSGKSAFAEELAGKIGNDVLYVATAIPFDSEMKLRIQKHRERRPAQWETLEAYRDLDRHLTGRAEGMAAVMLDCVTVMVSNIMLQSREDWDNLGENDITTVEEQVKAEIAKLLKVVEKLSIPFIAVTNETGMGIVPENAIARAFRDIAGRVNQMLAKEAGEVYFCVSGIPVKIK